MSTNIRRTSQLVAAVAAATFLVTACSSGSSKSTGGDSTTGAATAAATTGAAGSSSSSSSSGGGGAATGTPILLGSSGSLSNPAYSEPQLKTGLEAAVEDINANGGVKGHPIKLDFCDSAYDVNKELSCARKLISEKVVGVIHASILADSSGAEFKLYQAANIPFFGGLGLSPAENSNPDSYPLSSGVPGWFSGAAKALKEQGVKKIAIYPDSNPGSQYSASLIVGALKRLGVADAGTITADPKADPTFATSAAKIVSSGADGVVMTPGPVNMLGMVKALSQSGYKGKISTINTLLSPANLKALGSTANGIYVSGQFAFTTDTANPGVAKYLANMKQYEPKGIIDDTSLSGWSAMQLAAKILDTVPGDSIDNAAFSTALQNLSTPIDIGTVGPYAIKGKSPALPDFPRILNPYIAFGQVKDGGFVTDGKGFTDPFTT